MPLTFKGRKLLEALRKEYGERAEQVLYAGKNSGRFTGIDRWPRRMRDAFLRWGDDDWNESDHPRVQNGKNAGEFAPAGGGGGSQSSAKGAKSSKQSVMVAASNREDVPDHIKKLKLPPAWKDVKYNPDPDADLLAVGKDSKGRPQYVYSEKFQATQAQKKFERVQAMNREFDQMRAQNEKARRDKAKADAADCLRLIMDTGIRPGSDTDTKAKVKAYGASTLLGKHVQVDGDKVTLAFTGKKGVALKIPVDDVETAAMLRKRAEQAGPDGKLFPGASDKDLLEHTHSLDGGHFKTKDFRTLMGTRTALQQVGERPAPKNEKEYKAAVMDVARAVSQKLGNTPTIALQSYINPSVFASWRAAV